MFCASGTGHKIRKICSLNNRRIPGTRSLEIGVICGPNTNRASTGRGGYSARARARLGTRAEGKSEVKGAAFTELRIDPDSSRVFFDHHFRDVEAKSYPATILAIDLGDPLKDGSDLLRSDARSGVAH